MARRAWAFSALAWSAAALAQPLPAPDQAAPATIDRARITVSPALAEAVAARWTLSNFSDTAITAVQLRPAGTAEFGANLLERPVAPGTSIILPRAAGQCVHDIMLRFTNDGRRQRVLDLCEQPEFRVVDAPPPPAMAIRPPTVIGGIARDRPVAKQSMPPATIVPPPPPPSPAPVERPALGERPAPPETGVPGDQPRNGGGGAARPTPAPAPATPPPAPAARPPATLPATGPAEATAAPAPVPIADGPGPSDAPVYCPALEEEVPAIICQRATAVNEGVAGVKARPDMVLGEVQTVRLVVSRGGDAQAVEDELGGPNEVFRDFRLGTGRYMEARLTADSGLEITPNEWVRRDLGAGDLEDWAWQVKAVAEGRHRVTLSTRVMTRVADGRFIPRPGRESEPQYVEVRITRGQDIEQRIGIFTRWVDAISAPAESLGNLLTLLTTLLAAAGGLWAAIRAFGRKPPSGDSGAD